MRTNIDIDDALMEDAMRAGHFKTKKDAVEAGLALLARQAAYREILKWEGKLQWDGEETDGAAASQVPSAARVMIASEPTPKKPAPAKKKTHGRR